jgi:hypothetical protein
MPESRLVFLHRISATNDGVRRLAARAAARHRGQRRRQTSHLRSGAVCTSARVFHRSRNIGEAHDGVQLRQTRDAALDAQKRLVYDNHVKGPTTLVLA